MPRWRSTGSILCATGILVSHACATLPKVSITTQCGPDWQSAVRIQAVDSRGQIVPYASVSVVSDNRSMRYRTWTNSHGEARFPLQPGSYTIGIGDDYGQWQVARRSFKIPRDCQVDMQARLIRHEINPDDGPALRRRR